MSEKNGGGILRGKGIAFTPGLPAGRSVRLLREASSLSARGPFGAIATQHFADLYSHAWLYDLELGTEQQLDVELPRSTLLMVYTLQGNAWLRATGQRPALLAENRCSLLPAEPGKYNITFPSGNHRILLVVLSLPLTSLLEENHRSFREAGFPGATISELCAGLLEQLYQRELQGELWRLKRQVIVLDLLFKTLDELKVSYRQEKSSSYHRDYDTLKAVKEYVRENIDKKLSVQMLARRFGIQPTQLRRGYKKIFHHHLCDFIREVRLERARDLLLRTELPVHEVAWEVGYESSTTFTRIFASYFQLSPSDYRRFNTVLI
ncbi:helix-turn-helix domain-containing protein [Chitinophaga lutea]